MYENRVQIAQTIVSYLNKTLKYPVNRKMLLGYIYLATSILYYPYYSALSTHYNN